MIGIRAWRVLAAVVALTVAGIASASNEARHIRSAMAEQAATFQTPRETAIRQLNAILVTEYHGKGSIVGEKDAALRAAYEDAAVLLLNGHAVAGGALVQYQRSFPAFQQSPIGPAYARFLDAMLQPTADPDDFLHSYMERVIAVRPTIEGLPPEFQRPVELWVMGVIYDDRIAAKAGEQALRDAGAIPELVDSVRELAAAMAPSGTPSGEPG